MEKNESSELLKKEYLELLRNPITSLGLTIHVANDNYYKWKVSLVGPRDGPYYKGLFLIEIKFPENYPNSAPDIIFITPIYHLNVNPYKNESNGAESLGHLNHYIFKNWKTETKVRQMIIQLYSLFYFPNPELAYDKDIAIEYKFKKALYEAKAKYFTEKYDDYSIFSTYYDKSWDFSYDDSQYIPDENKTIKEKENESYKYDISDNEKIILNFDNNGINKISLECQMNELTRDVFQRCINKLGISKNIDSDEILFIYNAGKIDLNNSIRYNGLGDYYSIIIIYDFAA